jgi:hypothetical protein
MRRFAKHSVGGGKMLKAKRITLRRWITFFQSLRRLRF